jgi:threonine dehydrogenase-like Zn-dependent dehydrogenase
VIFTVEVLTSAFTGMEAAYGYSGSGLFGYGGLLDKVPFGAAFGKGITMKMGQTNMHTYMKPLLERIEKGQIDPSYIILHRITLDEAPEMYKIWRDKKEKVTKIVIDPWQASPAT